METRQKTTKDSSFLIFRTQERLEKTRKEYKRLKKTRKDKSSLVNYFVRFEEKVSNLCMDDESSLCI